jgi:hypothetical protein
MLQHQLDDLIGREAVAHGFALSWHISAKFESTCEIPELSSSLRYITSFH